MAESNYQDTLFEEISELTRADKGIVNVSGFNDMYLTNKRFFTASIDYFGSHWNDITQIYPDDYIKRLQDTSKNRQTTENILYRTVPELKEFAEFIKADSSGKVKRRLLALHRSESNKEVLDELERIIDKDLKAFTGWKNLPMKSRIKYALALGKIYVKKCIRK